MEHGFKNSMESGEEGEEGVGCVERYNEVVVAQADLEKIRKTLDVLQGFIEKNLPPGIRAKMRNLIKE